MSRKKIPAVVWKEGEWFVAKALSLEVASQGRTRNQALDNLQEAVDLLLGDERVKLSSTIIPKNVELTQVYA